MTRNIFYCHPAINKMALAEKQGLISGGIWLVPGGNLAPYLTDRTGNYPDFEPYLSLYSYLRVGFGYLGVAVVEHDEIGLKVPLIETQHN